VFPDVFDDFFNNLIDLNGTMSGRPRGNINGICLEDIQSKVFSVEKIRDDCQEAAGSEVIGKKHAVLMHAEHIADDDNSFLGLVISFRGSNICAY
jgi:trehalose-6-phosphatase